MGREPIIRGVGLVDSARIAGTAGIDVAWADLDIEAPGDGRTLRAVFGKSDRTYRRLDRLSRSLVLAAEAAGIEMLLSADERRDTGLLSESFVGCVEIDRRYTQSLDDEMVEAAIFPYTLPSTSLGEVALRNGLRGVTISMSVEPDRLGQSLREARRMFSARELRHVVACSVDVLDVGAPGIPPAMRTVVAVLAAADAGGTGVAPWPGESMDPFAAIADAVARRGH